MSDINLSREIYNKIRELAGLEEEVVVDRPLPRGKVITREMLEKIKASKLEDYKPPVIKEEDLAPIEEGELVAKAQISIQGLNAIPSALKLSKKFFKIPSEKELLLKGITEVCEDVLKVVSYKPAIKIVLFRRLRTITQKIQEFNTTTAVGAKRILEQTQFAGKKKVVLALPGGNVATYYVYIDGEADGQKVPKIDIMKDINVLPNGTYGDNFQDQYRKIIRKLFFNKKMLLRRIKKEKLLENVMVNVELYINNKLEASWQKNLLALNTRKSRSGELFDPFIKLQDMVFQLKKDKIISTAPKFFSF